MAAQLHSTSFMSHTRITNNHHHHHHPGSHHRSSPIFPSTSSLQIQAIKTFHASSSSSSTHSFFAISSSSSFADEEILARYGRRKKRSHDSLKRLLPNAVDRGGFDGGDGSRNNGNNNGRGGGGGGGGGGDRSDANENDDSGRRDLLSVFLDGWASRVRTDPQFPFKVLMEQVVGVGANVVGDMASRPNFGLHELDFVFSTLVVGSILNFSLMYMLAPTTSPSSSVSLASSVTTLPGIFSSCPPGHMFEPGAFSLPQRLGTFVFKGAVFAVVGFSAGLLGTLISNVLIGTRKRMDPSFKPQNAAPPTVLNAATWALHMGLSSNLRYQAVNGLEFTLARVLTVQPVFKASVFFVRAANNLLGGMSFVALAKLTGSQKVKGASEETKPYQ